MSVCNKWSGVAVTRMSVLSLICIFDLLLEVIFFLFRIDKHVCVKDSSVETCFILKTGDFFPI